MRSNGTVQSQGDRDVLGMGSLLRKPPVPFNLEAVPFNLGMGGCCQLWGFSCCLPLCQLWGSGTTQHPDAQHLELWPW